MKKHISFLLATTLLAAVAFIPSAGAVINQVDGTVVPQNYVAEMQVCLNRSEGAGVLDAVFDADVQPEVYLPVPGVQIHFVIQAEGAGYRNSFGWFNVGDDVSNPANLHEIFPCRTTATCACDTCTSGLWRHAWVDISASADYKGGYIGFWLITPELINGTGNNNDHCNHVNIPQHRIYYTVKLLNDDGDYVHFIVYTSVTYTDAFYFGFEDLFRGGDNDFEDMLVFVDGLVPPCTPRVEVCDNVDNDCDTIIDDGLTRPCSTVCGSGIETCVAGAWGACSARTPTGEVCDAVDNNCDGEIDEGLSRGCTSICEAGTEYCVMGAWVDCSARLPTSEICNNADDDCDGSVDEGNPGGGAPCGTDLGICERGAESCIGGSIICAGGRGPEPEVCNSLDDNCNGSTDEGDPGGGDTCGTDVGACQSGTYHCVGGVIICDGAIGPTAEVCNNVDDNCNGSVDEGNPGGGAPCGISTGECDPGIETCIGGVIVCFGGTGPTGEVCDGLDNDCDGLVDDGDPGGGAVCGVSTGECEPGVEHCVDGRVECVGGVGPETEICDGLDNDCDGFTDEDDPGGGLPCGIDTPACDPGTWHCIGGTLVCEGGTEPGDEVCNGLDDDCDCLADTNGDTVVCGAGDENVDEGNPGGGLTCGTDEGECEPGVTWCSASDVPPPCTPPDPLPDPPEVLCLCEIPPTAELCDCLDNDCDGLVDENMPEGEACGEDVGECVPGHMVCIDCEWQCSYDVGPSPEVCDCLDNDCNGMTDDGDICSGGICYADTSSCYCALPCNPSLEFPCPTGKVCLFVDYADDYYCLNDPCSGVTCPECTQVCRGGECIDKCDTLTCGEDETCDHIGCSALCVPRNCYATGYECEEGERCEDGACQPDPCWDVDCRPEEFCREGECFDACTEEDTCPEGRVCHDGECVDDPCWDAACTGGQVCDPETGHCVDDPCEEVSCPHPQVCIDGHCTDDPCAFIECPEGFTCVGDTCVEGTAPPDEVSPEPQPDASTGPLFVTGIGGGGCGACAVAGRASSTESGLPWAGLLLLIGTLLIAARRTLPKSALLGLMIAVSLLLALASAGCHADYECLLNCDAAVNEDADVEGDDGRDTDANVDGDVHEGDDIPAEEVPCNPLAEEECNGIDDNCNGEIDEGFDLQTDRRNCGECGNACNFPHAFAECQAGECALTECDINYYDCVEDDPGDAESLGCETPCFRTRGTDDICNEVDDDCDCVVDDDVDLLTDTENCGRCGVRCNDRNAEVACESPDGTPESAVCVITACSEGYWDLDGRSDTGCEYECSRCEGTWGSCEAGHTCCTASGDETCNGLDDNCEGNVDEGNPGGGEPCGTDVGECVLGAMQCLSGIYTCQGGVEPVEEECDGLDNDCDGEADEDNPEGGTPCGTDAGECVAGVQQCEGGTLVCNGEVPPRTELCNNLDDDCDGIVDDGNPEGGGVCGIGVGACVQGNDRCIGGVLVCSGSIDPLPEICDGLDNDCDGTTDEDNPEGGQVCGTDTGLCSTGVTQCVSGNLLCSGETPPAPELCNGLDDDCDGTADDGDPESGTTCGSDVGECVSGTIHCVAGTLDCTGEVPPATEQCNGRDDDCDGAVDDNVSGIGARCGTNRGTCEYGTQQCVGGSLQCTGGVTPVNPEPCDGLDNNCNGTVDDNLGTPTITCSSAGVCAGTMPSCDGAVGWACHYPPTFQSTESWCDALNNDCDAATDEGCPVLDASDIRIDTGSAAGAANSTQIDVATDGAGVVHVVYLDRRGGLADIYYNHSIDGGSTWMASDLRLDTNAAGATASVMPSVAHGSGDRAYAAWSDFRASTSYRDVYTVRSTNDGTTWSTPDVRVDTGLNTDSYSVDVAADGSGNVYVVYENLIVDRSRRVYLSRSADNGGTWAAPVRIDHNSIPAPHIASEPHVAVDGAGGVFIVWRDNRHGNAAVYFNYSLDSGVTWQATDTRLDTDMPAGNAYSDRPRIAADASGNVFVVWEDYRNGYADIYANSSANRGVTWRVSDTRLDIDTLGHDSLNPTVTADAAGYAWAAWEDLRGGLSDIYMSRTTNAGASWSAADIRVDKDAAGTGGSFFPSIDAQGVFVAVTWQDWRNGSFDVYTNYSLDSGVSVQPSDFRVDAAAGAWDAVDPMVVIEAMRAHFVWVDFRNGTHMYGDIYTRTLR